MSRRFGCGPGLLLIGLVLAAAPAARAQTGGPYDMTWNTFDGGGATLLGGGSYVLAGATTGQPDAAAPAGGAYAVHGGFWQPAQPTVGVEGALPAAPVQFRLYAARPNPFRGGTTIVFDLPRASRASLEVFGLAGERVRTLLDAERPAGRHQVSWDGRDASGRLLGSGIYFVRVRAGGASAVTKLVRAD